MTHVPAQTPRSPDETVHRITLHLRNEVERAIRTRGEEIIASAFAAARTGADAGGAGRKAKRAARARPRFVDSLTRQFLQQIDKVLRARVREAVARERAARAAAGRSVAATGESSSAKTPVGRRARRRPVRPPSPPLDPEQIRRDAEFARLRTLLRPTAEEDPRPAPASPAPSLPPQRPATPGEFLRSLEKEIQDAVPFLGRLGPERCGARIAAWAGQVRELRERLTPEMSAAMRPATRIFLEHLTELRAAMEASYVDALEPKWSPPSWSDYVEVNRARAEGRPPALPADRLEAHHRAMLKALLQPHRRNVPEQAIPVIAAAAEFLPADDGQLRSARRRHSAEWQAKAEPENEEPSAVPGVEPLPAVPEAEAPPEAPPGETVAEANALASAADEPSPAVPETPPEAAFPAVLDDSVQGANVAKAEDEPVASESEFEQPWTK
ncbi:MAG: hypothetical protein JXP73_15265 [Deltaproteobacteria bacterium]|nr:hypothetical protein [Deltaproteobacteria bacterium]